jgi:hypothetical protein
MVRTNYSSEAAWVELRRQAEATSEDRFRANLYLYSDPLPGDLTTDHLVDLVKSGPFRTGAGTKTTSESCRSPANHGARRTSRYARPCRLRHTLPEEWDCGSF